MAGFEVVVVDNLSNSDTLALSEWSRLRVARSIPSANIRDQAQLDQLFSEHDFSAVIHFAGLKAVGESVKEPLKYYDNNIYGTQVLLAAMQKQQVLA